MALAADQQPGSDKLSLTSKKMLALREAVFAEWEKRVRATVKEASSLQHPLLIDTLPVYYDNIVEAVSPDYPRTSATDSNTVAEAHGGERARLTGYAPQAVIHEYQLLRWTIFDILKQNGVALNDDETMVIHISIDSAIREAATAFALVGTALREQFLATLTHDLRTPLNVATLGADMICRSTDSPLIKDLATKVSDNLRRIDRMTQDLLDSMIIRTGQSLRLEFSGFDVLEVVHEVHQQASTVYGPRFQIIGNSVNGWWSRDALKRILENLISNAVKYGASDIPIRIKINEVHERLVLSVHNEGNPIAAKEIGCIFKMYERTRASKEGKQQGWGIGLQYVRSVAEGHGGSITVDSSIERGTTFTVDIPLDARPFQNAPVMGNAA